MIVLANIPMRISRGQGRGYFVDRLLLCKDYHLNSDVYFSLSGSINRYNPKGHYLTKEVDFNIASAVINWINYGIDPGSCTRLLLKGDYEEALKHAHPLIKPYWRSHVLYIESLPSECRGENMSTWKPRKGKL